MTNYEILILGIIVFSIVGIAIGSYPTFRMNRSTIALVGSTAIINSWCFNY